MTLIAYRCIPSEYRQITGVHSLERSAQEDTLLVLFNTAISNLVRESPHCGHLCLTILCGGPVP